MTLNIKEIKKYKAIINMIVDWLDHNINEDDEPDTLAEDGANLKEKIKLALDEDVSTKDVEDMIL
tara:strand:- start:714 stop:908 length:195 start_codon:yes stop_codon:yes gene_type:complete